jgi:hypothetical protein
MKANLINDIEPDVKFEELIALETARLSKEYGKTFLDCEDIIKLTGLGRDNVRALMNSKKFPMTRVGNRQVVSIVAFVIWQLKDYMRGIEYGS